MIFRNIFRSIFRSIFRVTFEVSFEYLSSIFRNISQSIFRVSFENLSSIFRVSFESLTSIFRRVKLVWTEFPFLFIIIRALCGSKRAKQKRIDQAGAHDRRSCRSDWSLGRANRRAPSVSVLQKRNIFRSIDVHASKSVGLNGIPPAIMGFQSHSMQVWKKKSCRTKNKKKGEEKRTKQKSFSLQLDKSNTFTKRKIRALSLSLSLSLCLYLFLVSLAVGFLSAGIVNHHIMSLFNATYD